MCLSRQAQLRAGPTLYWGVAQAALEEHSCIAHGDGCCEYTLRWYEPVRWRGPLFGAIAGLTVAGAASVRRSRSEALGSTDTVVGWSYFVRWAVPPRIKGRHQLKGRVDPTPTPCSGRARGPRSATEKASAPGQGAYPFGAGSRMRSQ